MQLWVADNRKAHEETSQDLARLTGVSVDTARAWESRGRPNEDAIRILEAHWGKSAPSDGAAGGDTLAASSDLLAALANQTAAIDRLIVRLDSLASQAIRDGVLDALREAGLGPDAGASPDEPPPGSQP